MAKYTQEGALPQAATNAIAQAVTKGVQAATAGSRAAAMNTSSDRKKVMASGMQKEAALARALTTEAGLRKIAANMANPVRFYLDYKGIFRGPLTCGLC